MSSPIHIVQVDVYSPDGSSAINHWVQDIIVGKIPEVDERIYYWVHIRDAERALKVLKLHNIQGNFHLSGRRAWNQKMVLDEITMLWNRFQNALHGTHSIQSLSEITSPAAFQVENDRSRPDLSPLHEALILCGTEGWRPLVPLRVGIMECIASVMENSKKVRT